MSRISEYASNLVDIACELVHQTKAAYLIYDGTDKIWVPKSQCEYADGVLTLPESIAKEKGLI